MIVRPVTTEEGPRTAELFSIAFEMPLNRDEPWKADPKVHNWGAFDEDGAMMSTFCITDFDFRFDGNNCKMGGIGGVATLPAFRRRGGIRGCFHAALPDMYEKGYDFSYLYPFSTAYYRKFGYESCVQKLNTVVDLSLLKAPAVSGTFRLAEKNCPMTDAIRALDRLWEARYNMMVIHDETFYNWTAKIDPAATGEYTYVYFAADGTPKAYTSFRLATQPDGRNLQCSRFCFADKEGFGGLMNLFQSLAADHKYVKFQLPYNPAMQYLFSEWSFGAVQWSVERGGMVRVVNVAEVLKKARYLGSGALTTEVKDKQIEPNNRRFHVVFESGRAVSVREADADPDIVMEIPAFSTLIAGTMDFADAMNFLDGVVVKNPNPCFSQVFYRKDLMIVDYF